MPGDMNDLEERLRAMTSAAASAAATAERACDRLVLYQGIVDAAKALHCGLEEVGGVYGDCEREVDAVCDAYEALERALAARPST
jgi:hypothetical protein